MSKEPKRERSQASAVASEKFENILFNDMSGLTEDGCGMEKSLSMVDQWLEK